MEIEAHEISGSANKVTDEMDEMDEMIVQMPLSEQDLRALKHTRGRRRLRDVEAKCPPGVLLKLKKDGDYGVLEISGPAEKVQIAQKRVEECTGPIKELSSAVWYELLRTRKGFGALNLIQKLTGCRLHLERNASQVRLLPNCMPNLCDFVLPGVRALRDGLQGCCPQCNGRDAKTSQTSKIWGQP